MKPRLIVVLALVLGACAFLLVKGLGDATVFFKNADEVDSQVERAAIGTKRFRLQGTVEQKTEDSSGVSFVVEYHCARVKVHHVGDPPELFKVGIPVVLEGSFTKGSETYESDKIFVKHTSEYRKDRVALAESNAKDLEACAK